MTQKHITESPYCHIPLFQIPLLTLFRKQSQIYDQLQVLNRKTESNDSYVESATGQGNITGPTQIVLVIAGKPKLLQFLNQLIKKIFFYFPALLSLQTFF